MAKKWHERNISPEGRIRMERSHYHNRMRGNAAMAYQMMLSIAKSDTVTPEAKTQAENLVSEIYRLQKALNKRLEPDGSEKVITTAVSVELERLKALI